MTNKIVVDCSTGEVQEIALTAEEIAEREAMAAEYAAQKVTEDADKAAKAVAKAELLDRLGITAEEAALLLS
jgi:hypothetical protein